MRERNRMQLQETMAQFKDIQASSQPDKGALAHLSETDRQELKDQMESWTREDPLRKLLEAAEAAKERHAPGVEDFIRRHPADWQEKTASQTKTAEGLMEMGEHLVAEALKRGDENAIAQGRALMLYATNNALADSMTTLSGALDTAAQSRDPQAKAEIYQAVYGRVLEIATQGDTEADTAKARELAAAFTIKQEHEHNEAEIGRAVADLDPSKAGGPSRLIGELASARYTFQISESLSSAEQALAQGEEIVTALRADCQWRDGAMALAAAYGTAGGPKLGEYEGGETHPIPELQNDLIHQAERSMAAHEALNARERTRNDPYPDYHLHNSMQLAAMATPGAMEQAQRWVAQNPGWRQEAAERANQYFAA